MTDQEYRKQKKRVRKLIEKWHAALGLRWWRIDYNFYRECLPDHPEAVALCTVHWEYKEADIDFCLPKCAELADDRLEYMYVHECCHVLVAEMREWAGDGDRSCPVRQRHEERVVTDLASAFLWVRLAGEGRT